MLAMYLWTAPTSSQYGLFYLPLEQLCAEAGYSPALALKVLDVFGNLEFAFYHRLEQWVWVKAMAQYHLMPTGKLLPRTDNRIKGLHSWYATVPDNPYLSPFFDHYAQTFYLPERREWSRPTHVEIEVVEPLALVADGTASLVPRGPRALPAPAGAPTLFPEISSGALVPVAGRNSAVARRRSSSTVDGYDPLFLEWFGAYPSHRRVEKREAYQEWLKIRPLPDRAWLDAALAVLERQKTTRDWLKDGGKYVSKPANYLAKGKYEDEVREHRFIPEADVDRAVASYQWGSRRDHDDPD